MSTHVIRHIGELITNDPSVGDGSNVGRIKDAALIVDEARVLWSGYDRDAPAADESIDVEGAAVIPGFVDSHTHVIFAGERSDEFEARMAGVAYDGGGIARTVAATRSTDRATLRDQSLKRVHDLGAGGVTTFEVKSGYELTLSGEERLVELASELSEEVTYLGAHVVPEEFRDDRDGYVALVAGAMLDACAPRARWADVFCDRGAFDVDEARVILASARKKGLGLRLHANQLADIGAISLAIEMDCASVDHCTHVTNEDLEALGSSSTVATLLPGAEFSTRSPYPSARRFLDAGVCVALATDCNPGTSYVTSMAFVIALGVREMGMSVDEALWASTRGGATALRRSDVGHLGVGARADFCVLDAPRVAHLAYRPGSRVVARTYRGER